MLTFENWIVNIALLLIIIGGITGLVAAMIPPQIIVWTGLILMAIGLIMLIAVISVYIWEIRKE